jgi:diguanylate cyclase (GGDEF)-like protein
LGILNRKAFMHALEKEFERSRRYNHPMAILFIDFDHFKSINDTHGHQFGDRVLQTACGTIRKTIREPDILGRYGGEELVVVLVECEPDNALNIAERIRRAIAGNVIQKRKTSIMAQVTVSIGVHYPNLARQRPATAVRYADKALYAAKKSGRNRVVVYEPGL